MRLPGAIAPQTAGDKSEDLDGLLESLALKKGLSGRLS